MKKLKLDLDNLEVESFATTPDSAADSIGTVHGYGTFGRTQCDGPCTIGATCAGTCDQSCNGTCNQSCNGTCNATCAGTCGGSCNGTCANDQTCNWRDCVWSAGPICF